MIMARLSLVHRRQQKKSSTRRAASSWQLFPCCTTATFAFVVVVLLVIAAPDHRCNGQRVITNLGKRIKDRLHGGGGGGGGILSRRRKSTRGSEYYVQGEQDDSSGSDKETQNRTTTTWQEYYQGSSIRSRTVVLATVGILVFIIGFSIQPKKKEPSKRNEEEDIVVQDDHVAPMAGMESIDLSFEDLRLALEQKKKNGGPRLILDGVQGRCKPGRMMAIMGPSGAGKSTVLHAIAGRVKDDPRLRLTGRRYLNASPVSGDSLLPAAFIEQDVNFFPHMTVRETLAFRVELKLGSLLSASARDEMVRDLLEQVGLTKAADTIVGNASVRGVSGGERKRLSIAVELISSPQLVFLDEPTSGLDSTAATSLVRTLRKLADGGKTVVAVIHQPSQHVFEKFDDLLLVSEGKLMYFGERGNVRSYFESQGCRAVEEIGTAEHILDCITRSPLENETAEDVKERMERIARAAADEKYDLGKPKVINGGKQQAQAKEQQKFHLSQQGGPRAGILKQFGLLLHRSLREIFRGKTALIIKATQQVSLGFIYGGIYSLGNDQSSIMDRIGLMSLIAIGASNMAVGTAIRAFPKEKAIVSNEIASKMYRTLPYFLGKALSELPLVALFNSLFGVIVYRLAGLSRMTGKFRRFLGLLTTHGFVSEATGLLIGAISPNTDVALALFPAILVLNVIFDGKNISVENTPWILRWVPKVGLIRWGYEGLCVNEFEGLEFVTKGPRRGPVAKNGAEALSRYGLGSNTVGDVFRAHMIITGTAWLLSYLGLTLTKQKFLVMKDPNNH